MDEQPVISVKDTPIQAENIGEASAMRPGGRGGFIKPPADSQTAREMSLKRWDNYRKASEVVVRDRVAEVLGVQVTTKWAAWAALMGVQAGIAAKGGKGSTQAAVLVGRAIDALPDRSSGKVEITGGGTANVPDELLVLAHAMRERVAADPEFAQRVAVARRRLYNLSSEEEKE